MFLFKVEIITFEITIYSTHTKFKDTKTIKSLS